jgi:methionyl-tRNA formyltransferase
MNIAFAGTPEFAATALEALIRAGHNVKLVLTQPDRQAGRGLRVRSSPVKLLAQGHGLSVLQPPTLKEGAVVAALAAQDPDVMVVAAYGLVVPKAVLELPRRGCINIHASLLPRWRGAAPIQRALLAGDTTTGITIMQMDEGLDTGPILLQEPVPIRPDDTAGTLHDRLAALGGRLVVEALAAPASPRSQNVAYATYAPKIDMREAHIDWQQSAEAIERKVRAFDPVPGARTTWGETVLKIWRARVERGVEAAPGEVCESGAAGIVVACGKDGLRLMELQRSGGKRLPVRALLAGLDVPCGARFGE